MNLELTAPGGLHAYLWVCGLLALARARARTGSCTGTHRHLCRHSLALAYACTGSGTGTGMHSNRHACIGMRKHGHRNALTRAQACPGMGTGIGTGMCRHRHGHAASGICLRHAVGKHCRHISSATYAQRHQETSSPACKGAPRLHSQNHPP